MHNICTAGRLGHLGNMWPKVACTCGLMVEKTATLQSATLRYGASIQSSAQPCGNACMHACCTFSFAELMRAAYVFYVVISSSLQVPLRPAIGLCAVQHNTAYIKDAFTVLHADQAEYSQRLMASRGGRVLSVDAGIKNTGKVRAAPCLRGGSTKACSAMSTSTGRWRASTAAATARTSCCLGSST